MKKILFVSKMNDLTKGLIDYLNQFFSVNYSAETGKSAISILELTPPDLVVMLLVGAQDFDTRIFDTLATQYMTTPVITIGTESEKNHFQKYYGGWQFENLVRPIEHEAVLEAICNRLGISSADPTGGYTEPDPFEDLEIGLDKDFGMSLMKPTVLIVDDNAATLRNVKSLLSEIYDVMVAPSGIKAMAMLGKRKPDVILLDYEMPVVDGKQTFEMIRADEEYADIPVIFLTGVDDKAHIVEVLAMNPAGYLLKPPMQEQLISTIEKALMKSRAK